MTDPAPTIDDIRALRASFGHDIIETPVYRCTWAEERMGGSTEVRGKLEFLQRTGTFKARGALSNLRALDAEQRRRGVTAVSAGNHAVATAFAAQTVGTSARVVMLKTSNRARVERCREYGAEIVFADDVHEAFDIAARIEAEEGRVFVHPFEGRNVALGTGTIGLEMAEQWPSFDTLIVPVGGGGLIAGIANAVRQLKPDCTIIGVEPYGADTMWRSFEAGTPQSVDRVKTIADSLGAPYALPYSFELTRQCVDRIVRVEDSELSRAMAVLFRDMRIAVEPACAAATAALLGPLREALLGRRVMLTFCGSNIDWASFAALADFDA